MEPVAVVLFDLGGVLIDFGGVGPMGQLSGIDDEEEVWRRWLTCRWVRDFERGRCSPDEFAAGVIEDWGLPITPSAYLAEFASWIGDALPGAPELVAEVQQVVPVGCLSNSNEQHWEHRERWPFLEELDHRFLSFQLGELKPDRAVFDLVVEQLGVPAGQILFLDDNTINTDAAVAAGHRAARVRGPVEARAALVDAGVLGP
jgi:putative hydrolase of the HAD superfamily